MAWLTFPGRVELFVRWLAVAWLLVAAARALDGFAADPAAYPLLQHVPPLSSLATFGAITLMVVASSRSPQVSHASQPAP